LSTPHEARQFVTETKVDVLAPAVGNSHGMRESMVTGKERKHLAIERIRRLEAGRARREDEVVPYKILPSAVAAVHDVVSARLRLFAGRN
jgi:fructose-bisphosphate aldolase, class II